MVSALAGSSIVQPFSTSVCLNSLLTRFSLISLFQLVPILSANVLYGREVRVLVEVHLHVLRERHGARQGQAATATANRFMSSPFQNRTTTPPEISNWCSHPWQKPKGSQNSESASSRCVGT